MSDYTLYIYLDESIDESIKQYYHKISNSNEIPSDSGFDIVVPNDVTIKSLDINSQFYTEIDHKIVCKLEKNGKPTAYYLYPRSSFSKTPLIMANHVGIIDKDYRGTIKSRVRFISPIYSYHVSQGTKLFQLCSPDLSPMKIIIVDSLEELGKTTRGSGGFGSTGSSI